MRTNLALVNTDLPSHRRLRIEYFDQNESFASQLPRLGTIEHELVFSDSAGPWFLVKLDSPVLYEGQSCSRLLLGSRWDGYPIGGQEVTSVFILLVPEGLVLKPDQSRNEFTHVAWGLVYIATLILAWQHVTWYPGSV